MIKQLALSVLLLSSVFLLSGQTIARQATHATPSQNAQKLSDSSIRKKMIKDSINAYPGNCPCPYNAARNGSSCGRRSAYNRPGGYAPLCYQKDITKDMIKRYRESHIFN